MWRAAIMFKPYPGVEMERSRFFRPTPTDAAAMRHLLAAIDAEVAAMETWTGRAALKPDVRAAIGRVPRRAFVAAAEAAAAYENRPLPIGAGQTISQPSMVAIMTDLLDCAPGRRVLEIGTGSGYQAAILAELGARVFSIETVPALAAAAGERLRDLGYGDIELRCGDGGRGWPEAAPFDGIVVTAAASALPRPLVEQLAAGGRMVVPIGPAYGEQQLVLVTKDAAGGVREEALMPVAFVPFV